MIKWLFMAPLSLLVSLLCYITNPIVLLFCDEDGELPGFLSLWQTWDNSCNPSDVTEKKELPDFLLYDWGRHYAEYVDTPPELAAVGRSRWFTVCIDHDWTIMERIKRYICRCYWLTRNCAYGWTFWVFGVLPGIRWKVDQSDADTKFSHEDVPMWWLDSAWQYASSAPICKIYGYTIRREINLGWKVDTDATVDTQAMIATRVTIRIRREGE
jgi:hypothetical protein